MATAVIVASDHTYGSRCQEAFRKSGLFPVVVDSAARALMLLAQFRASVIVVERGTATPALWEPLLADLAGTTPLLTYAELPPPAALAAIVREVLGAAPREGTEAPS